MSNLYKCPVLGLRVKSPCTTFHNFYSLNSSILSSVSLDLEICGRPFGFFVMFCYFFHNNALWK